MSTLDPRKRPTAEHAQAWWWPLLAGLLWLGSAGVGRAALQFDVFVGYGPGANEGVVRESAWFPVVFEVYNDGPGFNGVVELAQQSGQVRTFATELPTGTRKRFTIPAYCSTQYGTMLDARLRDERGRIRAESLGLRPRLTCDWRSPVLGGLPRTRGGLPALPEPKQKDGRFQPFCAMLQPELFPDHPITLEGLQTIYLHSARALELKAPQAAALMAWLHGGGHLIVAVEQPGDINAVPWLKTVLPCELDGLIHLTNHAELQAWLTAEPEKPSWTEPPVAAGSASRPARTVIRKGAATIVAPTEIQSLAGQLPNPYDALARDAAFEAQPLQAAGLTMRDGWILAGTPEHPLIASAARGRGQVTVLAFSPELEPFRTWRNKSWFWARLSGVSPEWLATGSLTRQGGRSLDGIFGAMIDSRQIRKLPVGWLLALLVAYLVVIGPLDYFWLKRINRQMLTWLTFPAYVALFSGLIYLIGYKLRAGQTEWNEFHVVDVMSHGDRADLRGRTYGSLYSPMNADYPVASDQPFATLRGEQGRGGGAEVSRARIEQQGNHFNAQLSVPVWTSQLYEYDWWRQDPAPLRVKVQPVREGWRLEVRNPAHYPVTKACLAVAGRWFELGDLTAGTTNLLQREAGQALRLLLRSQLQQLGQAADARQNQLGSATAGRLDDYFTSATTASFISLAGGASQENNSYGTFGTPAYFDLAPQLERGDAVLLAYLPNQSLVPPLNKFTPLYSGKNTLLRIVLPEVASVADAQEQNR